MLTLTPTTDHLSDQQANHLLDRLSHSALFIQYRNSFRKATGLPLRIVSADIHSWCLDDEKENRSPFCEKLNLCEKTCGACVEVNSRLMKESIAHGSASCKCFAGLSATAIPITCDHKLIGFLKTGQVFTKSPSKKSFEDTIAKMGKKSLTPQMIEQLKTAYFHTQTVDPIRYESMIDLLKIFSTQLSEYATTVNTVDENAEPEAITKAKNFILKNLDQSFSLGEIAGQVGMSESHLCRTFRSATGVTISQFVAQCRINKAKKELAKTKLRISEIAYQIGFQSLSQFNRTFAKVVGISPSEYRKDLLAVMLN